MTARPTEPCPFYGMPCEFIPMAHRAHDADCAVKELRADLADAKARINDLEMGLSAIVHFDRPLTRAQVREACADVLSGVIRPMADQSGVARVDGTRDFRNAVQAKYERARERAEKAEAQCARLEAALTPSAETKAALIGEFSFTFGEFTPNVPWTAIKQIMAAIRAYAA